MIEPHKELTIPTPPLSPDASDMRLGIMQPYFFPYAGYFGLMAAVDMWIVFDTPQYIRKGWVNRNRVLTTGSSPWKYLTVPVAKAPRDTPIHQIELAEPDQWLDKAVSHLDYYRNHRAPFYDQTLALLGSVDADYRSSSVAGGSLNRLLVATIRGVCQQLEIGPPRLEIFSEMNCKLPSIEHAGEWALRISEAVGAEQYINPSGGVELFDPQQFEAAGISLRFLEPSLPEYAQRHSPFINGLSILDLMMWLSPDEVREIVQDHVLK